VPIPSDGTQTELYVGPKDHKLLADASAETKQTGGPQVDLGEAINYGFLAWMRRGLAVPILWSINALQRPNKQLWHRDHPLHDSDLLAVLPAQVAVVAQDEEGAEVRAAHERAAGKAEGDEADDPRMKELQMEQLRLMKEANPLGGCLPLLIQMPFLFALYTALTISIDFRQASFLWIPDLSAPEPYLLGFLRLLPILFCGSMIFLQLLTRRLRPIRFSAR
jgi:YidC/Oxa1 family membrane protein insertase